MDRFTSSSSNIKTVAYEDEILTVTFRNDRTYNYSGVPREVYDELSSAERAGESVGRLFNVTVRSVFEGEEVS